MARELVKWEPFGEVSRLRREMDRLREDFFGPRAFRLAAQVEADKIDARYENGVLTITCPKKEELKPKAIEIKTA